MMTLNFPISRTLSAASVGDRLRVRFAGRSSTSPDVTREVTVTAIRGAYVYVTSGKVRPGHFSGGLLRVDGEIVTYQPTLAQPVVFVRALAVLASAMAA